MSSIIDNLEGIRARIREAAERAGRNPSDVRLLAVSKTQEPEAIRAALDAGQQVFGESRVQEAEAKIRQLPASVEWHFIGHLQSNKIRKALPLFHLFHGVDNEALAVQMNRIGGESGSSARILLEVNVSGERTKFGFEPEALRSRITGLLALPHLRVTGLMTLAPYSQNPGDSAPYFAALRRLRDELEHQTGAALPELSMGMSGDFEPAIAEGSTIVRIGSAIFGERPPKQS